MQKEIVFKSKDFVEGIVVASIDFYEQQNGSVSEDSTVLFSIKEIGYNYEVCLFIPIEQTITHDPATGDYVETKYADFTINLNLTEKLSSFIDDIDSGLRYLSDVKLSIIHKNL